MLFVKQQRSLDQGHDTNLEEVLSALQTQVSVVVKEANLNGSAGTSTSSTASQPMPSNARLDNHNSPPPAEPEAQRFMRPIHRPERPPETRGNEPPELIIHSNHSINQFTMMECLDGFDSSSMFFCDDLDIADVDWNALAAAFDLPSHER